MDVEIDSQFDMAYISVTSPGESRLSAHTEALIIDLPNGHRHLINLDFDPEGRLLGIEIDNARSSLPASLVTAFGGR